MVRHLFGIILIFLLFCSYKCSKKSKNISFDQKELVLLNQYVIADTIYFKSNFGNIDTIRILDIWTKQAKSKTYPISLNEANHVGISIKHLPFDKWYSTTFLENGNRKITCQNLISISRFPENKKITYRINYKDFYFSGNDNFGKYYKLIKINGYEINDCYKIKHSSPERIKKHHNIRYVYWTKKYGLTAYCDKKGEKWLLHPLPAVPPTVPRVPSKK